MPTTTQKPSRVKPPAKRATAAKPATPMDLLAAALTNKLPAESIAELVGFIERDRKAGAEQAFIAAMLDFKTNDLPEIVRNATGTLEGEHGEPVEYDYATLDRLCDHLIPALAKQRIIHAWEPQQPHGESGAVCISAVLTHELGHSVRATLQAGPDFTNGKNAVQAIGSTTTYLERYTLLAVCGIAVSQQSDMDGASTSREQRQGSAGERRQQPRTETYVTTGQHAINGPDLTKAITSIQAGRYTYQKLTECYALTRPQLEEVHKALDLPAPVEEMPQ